MDINTERLITALETQVSNKNNAGVIGTILWKTDNPLENLKSAEHIYVEQFKHLQDDEFISLMFALIELHFDKNSITDVEFEEAPGCEPQCDHEGEGEIDCEYEVRHGCNWCITHNCYA